MNDEQNFNTANDDVFVADANEFDDNLDAQLPAWPKVVGIISIVWGSIGVICNGVGIAGAVAGPALMGGMADSLEGGMPPAVTDPPITGLISAVLGVLLSIFLIMAGAMTLMRKIQGRMMHLIYAPTHIVLMIWGVMIQLQSQSAIADWVAANPDADFSQNQNQMGGAGQAAGMAIMFVMIAIFLIWPVFNLVWFGAIKKTHEDMTGGVEMDTI